MKLETYNTKLIFTAILLFFIFLFSTPVFAAGLVPCGTTANPKACTVCDFFVLIQNIINLILIIFASLATLAIIYIAFIFMFSGGSPTKIADAKGKLWLVIIGIFWVLGSWLVLNTVLNFMVNKRVFPWPWNQINCSVSKPSEQTPSEQTPSEQFPSGQTPSEQPPSEPPTGQSVGDWFLQWNIWVDMQGLDKIPQDVQRKYEEYKRTHPSN